MQFRITRIRLKSGEVVTEREFAPSENVFEGKAPIVGEVVSVKCRGREMRARVIWGNWPGREIVHPQGKPHPLRVEEI
jgi:hypothetical protein